MTPNDKKSITNRATKFKDEKTGHEIKWQVPLFLHHQIPYGFLPPNPEAHALWYYYLCAAKNYEEQTEGIVYEGDPDPIFDYHQLFKSIATSYGIEPEVMVKFWKYVDQQAFALALPLLPKEKGLRFDSIPEIETEKEGTDNADG